jgi:hypothetical protein
MGDSIVERFGCRVLGEAQDLAAVDPGQTAGASDEQEAQRAHAAEGEGAGPLPRARFRAREGLELEAAQEVVGEDTQVLPDCSPRSGGSAPRRRRTPP